MSGQHQWLGVKILNFGIQVRAPTKFETGYHNFFSVCYKNVCVPKTVGYVKNDFDSFFDLCGCEILFANVCCECVIF